MLDVRQATSFEWDDPTDRVSYQAYGERALSGETGQIADVDPTPEGSARRSTAIFALWTGVSRVAGLIRESIASAKFGTGPAAAAFAIAFNIPNLLRSLVADAALSAAFVPMFARLREQGRHEEAKRLAGALIGLISMVLGAISLLAIVTAPVVMPWFGHGWSGEQLDMLVGLSQVMFPIVVLLGLTGLVMGLLQSYGEFSSSAFAPVLWNVAILFGLIGITPFLDGNARIYGYAVGIVLGTTIQLLYLLPGLRGKGPFPISLGRGNPHVRRVLVMMLPTTIALGMINVNATVDIQVAKQVSDQSIRAIEAAFRLYILPQGVFSVAISTVLFPMLARLAARDDHTGMGRVITDGTRQIFFMLVPSAVFLALLATPVTRVVNEHQAFTASDTALTANALFFFVLGLVFNGASLLLIRAFFSLQLPWIPTKIAAVTVVVNLVLDLILIIPLGTGGIPLSTSIGSFLSFVALLVLLSRQVPGIDFRDIAAGFAQTLVASAFLAAWGFGLWHALDGVLGRSIPAQVASLGAATAMGALAYLAACHGLSIREMSLLRILRSRLR